MKLKTLLLGLAMAGAFTSASALTVVTGNVPQIDSNLVRNPCGLATPDTGLSVQGCLNNNHLAIVDLTSDEVINIDGGQADITATTGDELFSRLTISTAGLSTLILDIDASVDGFVTFTDGAGTSNPFALDDNGSNFFTLTGIVGNFVTFITSVDGAETDIVSDVKQVRLGTVAAIPEPETYALMMAGLAAVGFISRRRKARR